MWWGFNPLEYSKPWYPKRWLKYLCQMLGRLCHRGNRAHGLTHKEPNQWPLLWQSTLTWEFPCNSHFNWISEWTELCFLHVQGPDLKKLGEWQDIYFIAPLRAWKGTSVLSYLHVEYWFSLPQLLSPPNRSPRCLNQASFAVVPNQPCMPKAQCVVQDRKWSLSAQ